MGRLQRTHPPPPMLPTQALSLWACAHFPLRPHSTSCLFFAPARRCRSSSSISPYSSASRPVRRHVLLVAFRSAPHAVLTRSGFCRADGLHEAVHEAARIWLCRREEVDIQAQRQDRPHRGPPSSWAHCTSQAHVRASGATRVFARASLWRDHAGVQVPLNFGNAHWALLRIDLRNLRIELFDSAASSDTHSALPLFWE